MLIYLVGPTDGVHSEERIYSYLKAYQDMGLVSKVRIDTVTSQSLLNPNDDLHRQMESYLKNGGSFPVCAVMVESSDLRVLEIIKERLKEYNLEQIIYSQSSAQG